MTAYDLVEWKCHLEGEILTGGNRQVTSKCPRVEIDECLGWNMTRGAGWRRARQQKAGQSLETELELSCGPKSVCMQSFNNVNPSCILIQIELDQLGRENWGESVRECESVMLHSEPKERQKNARKKETKSFCWYDQWPWDPWKQFEHFTKNFIDQAAWLSLFICPPMHVDNAVKIYWRQEFNFVVMVASCPK